jgi:peptidyl-prolyl cis-trans isomerase C
VLRHDRQRLIDRMIADEIDGKAGLPELGDEELRRYYDQHPELFTAAEAVRVSQILVNDAGLAAQVAAAARALSPRDERGFRRLVAAHSLDLDSKERGGDLTFIERGGPQPPALVEAAFALKAVGEVSGPVKTERGFHVLRLTGRRPAGRRPFEEARAQARTLAQHERRARRIEEWVAEMRKRVNIQIFEDKLKEVAASP